MKVPQSGKEISKKWAEYILKEHAAATHTPALLQVDTCTVSEETGDGYNSQVVFFTVETTEKEEFSSPEAKKVYHLVGKFLSQNMQSRALNEEMKTNLKEYLVYTELITAMNNMLNAKAPEEPKISLPKLIYGKCTSKEFVLVMENLQYTGYEMNDKRKGLDGEQLKAAVDQIARVHAVSYVFCESADTSKYSFFPSPLNNLNDFGMMMGGMLDVCIEFLTMSKETEDLGKKIHQCKSTLMVDFKEKLGATTTLDDYTIKCLTHGDYWNNNMMFKYADAPGQNIIEEVKLIDWGNCYWGTPVLDLLYLVYTSTTHTIRKTHLEELLSHYHQTFMRLTTHLGSPPANWSLEQLKTEWNKSYVFGFFTGFALTLTTLCTTNPVTKKPEPSVLDNPLLLPIKFIVDGMKMGAVKIIMPLVRSSAGKKILAGFIRRLMKPISEEVKSGKNEVMNKRLLELLYEADENGLFTT